MISNKILIIDDNINSIELTKEIINTFMPDINVLQALNGPDGIEIVKNNNVDLILLDLNMPDMNGIEVCHKLRNDKSVHYAPIIFLTGMNVDSSVRAKALTMGGEEFITKPIQTQELVARINAMLRVKRMRDKVKEAKEQAEESLSYMKLMWEFSSDVLKITNFHTLGDRITQIGVGLTKAKGGFLNIYDNIDDKFMNVSLYLKNHSKEYIIQFDKLKFVGFTGMSSMIINDVKEYSQKAGIPLKKIPFKNMLIVPLATKKFIFGVIVLFDKEEDFTDQDIIRMETYSNFVSGVLYNIYFSEKHLKYYEKKYEALFNTIDIPIFLMDMKGNFLDFNNAFAEILNYKSKFDLDIINFYDIIKDKADINFLKERIRLQDRIQGKEIQIINRDKVDINILLNMEKEVFSNSDNYIIKGTLANLSNSKNMEGELSIYKQINETLYLINNTISKKQKMDQYFKSVSDILRKSLVFESVYIGIFDNNPYVYDIVAESKNLNSSVRLKFSEKDFKTLVEEKKPSYHFSSQLEYDNLTLPMRYNDRLLGFISLYYKKSKSPGKDMLDALLMVINSLVEKYTTSKKLSIANISNKIIEHLVNEDVEPTFILDSSFKILQTNKAFEKLIGMKRDDIIGKFCYELVHNTENPIKLCPLMQYLKSGELKEQAYFEPILDRNIIEYSEVVKGGNAIVAFIQKIKDK